MACKVDLSYFSGIIEVSNMPKNLKFAIRSYDNDAQTILVVLVPLVILNKSISTSKNHEWWKYLGVINHCRLK